MGTAEPRQRELQTHREQETGARAEGNLRSRTGTRAYDYPCCRKQGTRHKA